jgi:hypothetical protein
VVSEEVGTDLHALHRYDWSISALAGRFHLHRRAVRRELVARPPRGYPLQALRNPFTPAQLAHIERRLAVCPALRATDLHHDLGSAYGYTSSYTTFPCQLGPPRPATPGSLARLLASNTSEG